MNLIPARVRASPALVRVFPFVLFIALTALQPYAGETGQYWIYLLKTVVAGAILWSSRSLIPEMRWKLSWEGLAVGAAVFLVWIKLGDIIRAAGFGSFGEWRISAKSWNPAAHYGSNSPVAEFFLAVRVIGSVLVVPPMEEVFYRSFVYRYIRSPNFEALPLGQFFWAPFLITSVLFGFEHREWLAGILCGFAYQGLVCWKKRLGDAITAHAVTNGLLAFWVIAKQQWQFW
ncbi:MAG TPA: CAAX prenyl protease-related protein [Verrucomicrobiae bacterium]|nr:CAAX prenyl protease-related protein [Verrucomicrobiae bacterium]